MKIALLIIASEVLDGKTQDANTFSLARELRPHGLEIQKSMTIRDSFNEIQEALQHLFLHHDMVITSGGLGPTQDDLTKKNVGLFFHKKLIYSAKSQAIAEENYARFDKNFPGKNHGYCYLPEDFTPIPNLNGFAPGLDYFDSLTQKRLFSAPGVPWEFLSMVKNHLLPQLITSSSSSFSSIKEPLSSLKKGHFIARTKNIPEEKIFSNVDPHLWDKLVTMGEVSSLPNTMGVDVGVKYSFSGQEEAKKIIHTIQNIFNDSPLSEFIWHYGEESLEEIIISKAKEKKLTFGFAESATGGLCSDRLTNISGSSSCFIGSIICYHEHIKRDFLDVSAEDIKAHTVVSSQVATQMAQGLRKKFQLDLAVSITGYAGPYDKDLGQVFIAIARSDSRVIVKNLKLTGERKMLKRKFSQQALYLLLEEVENFSKC